MLKSITLPLLALLLISSCAVRNPISEYVDDKSYRLLDKIDAFDQYYGRAVGYAGKEPEEWRTFQKFQSSLSSDEVEYIVNNYSGVVKMYAYQAGVMNGYEIVDTLLEMHLSDQTTVPTFIGCLITSQTVGDFILTARTFPLIGSKLTPLTEDELNRINK